MLLLLSSVALAVLAGYLTLAMLRRVAAWESRRGLQLAVLAAPLMSLGLGLTGVYHFAGEVCLLGAPRWDSAVALALPLGMAARVAVTIALIAPMGLAMGMPFPRGLQRAGHGSLPAPPFYWGLNGIMSVIGSVTTVFVALMWGFQAAMLIGSGCYLLAAVASRSLTSTSTP